MQFPHYNFSQSSFRKWHSLNFLDMYMYFYAAKSFEPEVYCFCPVGVVGCLSVLSMVIYLYCNNRHLNIFMPLYRHIGGILFLSCFLLPFEMLEIETLYLALYSTSDALSKDTKVNVFTLKKAF